MNSARAAVNFHWSLAVGSTSPKAILLAISDSGYTGNTFYASDPNRGDGDIHTLNFADALAFTPVNGLRYAVRDFGPRDGIPLLLLHGLADTGMGFAPLVADIASRCPGRYRFIAPDWRGHGDSEHIGACYWFPEYLADLDGLVGRYISEDQPVVLVGHSMGGQVASQYAGIRPRRVSHLITLDSLNIPEAGSQTATDRYRRWLDALREPLAARHYNSLQMFAARIGQRYPRLTKTQTRFLAENWSAVAPDGSRRLRCDPWQRVPFPYGFRVDEAMASWREVTAHVLCIDGGQSPALARIGATEMTRRRQCFRDARHAVIPGCGHMLHVQEPAGVGAEITAFLSDQPA